MNTLAGGWYNINDQRAYPLDETGTLLDDSGNRLSNSLLADAHICFQKGSEGQNVLFLSGFTISPNGTVSLTILACVGSPASAQSVPAFMPVASLSVVKPKAYRPYPVQGYRAGTSGWIVFGKGVERASPVAHRMSSPAQASLCPRAARVYDSGSVVTGIGIRGTRPLLTGVVKLITSGDLHASITTREIENVSRRVLLLELAGDDAFMRYAGPCAGRPENDNCDRPTIRSFGGATPDCDGNIDLEFRTPSGQPELVDVYPIQWAGGGGSSSGLDEGTVMFEYALGVKDVCPPLTSLPIEGWLPPMPGEGSSSSFTTPGGESSMSGCASFVLPFEDPFDDPVYTACYWYTPVDGCPAFRLPFEDDFDFPWWTDCYWVTINGRSGDFEESSSGA